MSPGCRVAALSKGRTGGLARRGFFAPNAEFFRKSDFGNPALFVVLDRRDLFTIGTLEGRKLREPSKLGDNSDKLHPVTAGRARQKFLPRMFGWHGQKCRRPWQDELKISTVAAIEVQCLRCLAVGWAERPRSARSRHTSTCSAIARASSTSMPR